MKTDTELLIERAEEYGEKYNERVVLRPHESTWHMLCGCGYEGSPIEVRYSKLEGKLDYELKQNLPDNMQICPGCMGH